jgi:hypothetical protein
MFSRIKSWLIRILGGYTQQEYIDGLNKINLGYIFYEKQVYDPVRVNYSRSVKPSDIVGESNVKKYMEFMERDAVTHVLEALKDSKAITVTRTENKYGDIDIVASINVLMPQKRDSNNQSL